MHDATEIALRKYELVAKNIEFLDGWVMKITAMYGVFIAAVIANVEPIFQHSSTSKVWVSSLLGVVGILFLLLLWRIDFLMKRSRDTMSELECFFGEVGKHEAVDSSWGNGLTTTVLCGGLILSTMAFVEVVLASK